MSYWSAGTFRKKSSTPLEQSVQLLNDWVLQANATNMLVNDGEMLVNGGELLVNDGEMLVNNGEMSK